MNRNQSFRSSRISRNPIVLGAVLLCLPIGPANGDDGPEHTGLADSVLQPGIVEDISDSTPIFDFSGPSPIRAGFTIEGYHDDNIFIRDSGSELGDFVWEIMPKVFFESSRPEDQKRTYLQFGYDPQVLRYTDFGENDAENHRAFTRYRLKTGKIDGGFNHRSAQFSGTQRELEGAFFDTSVDADVGRRTQGTRHYTRAFADLELSGATVLELAAYRITQDFTTTGIVSSEEFKGEAFLVNRLSKKTEAGLGSRFGRFDTDGATDTDYLDALASIRWATSPKLILDVEGGADFREIDAGTGSNSLSTPVFRARLNWLPREVTMVAIDGFHQVRNSVNGQNVRRIGIRGTLRQQLARQIHYTLSGGYERGTFETFDLRLPMDRQDDYVVLQQGLDCRFGDRSLIGFFHEFRMNESNRGANFERNQIGFRITIEN